MRIGVFGASGFVGGAVAGVLKGAGHEVTALSAPRLTCDETSPGEVIRGARRQATRPEFEALLSAVQGHAAVINCAGLAAPDSPTTPELTGANALLPLLLYALAQRAGVEVFVHVSSAAVQGRRPVLDETYDFDLRSPYAKSKALGEVALRDAASGSTKSRVFRATSVQATERSITQTLLRLAHAPFVPLAGAGDHPLPLSLLENTAAAIAHTTVTPEMASMVTHPWEGITTKRFFTLVNPDARLLQLPRRTLSTVNDLLWWFAPRSSLVAAVAKRADLMISGQRSTSGELVRTGFVPPVGDEGYVELGRRWRRSQEAA